MISKEELMGLKVSIEFDAKKIFLEINVTFKTNVIIIVR